MPCEGRLNEIEPFILGGENKPLRVMIEIMDGIEEKRYKTQQ